MHDDEAEQLAVKMVERMTCALERIAVALERLVAMRSKPAQAPKWVDLAP